MLIVKFNGGLGNQLFQYAFFEYLRLNGQKVYADLSDYQYHYHHYGYEIEKVFGCRLERAGKKQIRALAIDHDYLIVKCLEKVLRIKICKESEFYELNRISVIEGGPIEADTYFSGYWQNVHYVHSTENVLRKRLVFKEPMRGKDWEWFEQFKHRDTVSVHVRRKDYLQNKNLGGICTEPYYMRAIDYMRARLYKPMFIFFSDDIEWCRDRFREHMDTYYVDWNKGKDSYKDMRLMSLCKNNIIANSSFSWWGAWLNDNKDKIVIMPKRWTRYSDSTVMSPGWVRM